jgi:hypothetical protein
MSKLLFDAILARLDALERKLLGRARRRISRAEKAKLEGVTPRTIARRVAAGLLEQPDIINGRWYFWVDEAGQLQRGTSATAMTNTMEATDTAAARAVRNPRLRRPAHTTEAR